MAKSDEQKQREQRLAAKLRENLKRRKVQARQRDAAPLGGKTAAPKDTSQ